MKQPDDTAYSMAVWVVGTFIFGKKSALWLVLRLPWEGAHTQIHPDRSSGVCGTLRLPEKSVEGITHCRGDYEG